MRIDRVLHPEMVLGLRGDEFAREWYKLTREPIKFMPGQGFQIDYTTDIGAALWAIKDDQNAVSHHLLTWKYFQERPQTYYASKDFLEAMKSIDREIPVDMLPAEWFGYIAFADGAVFDESDEIQGAYVYVGPAEKTMANPTLWGQNKKCLWISYVCKSPKRVNGMVPQPAVGSLLLDLRKEKLSEMTAGLPFSDWVAFGGPISTEIPQPTLQARDKVFLLIINLVLYISCCINADLLPLPTHRAWKPKKKRDLAKAGNLVNECTIPVTLVSWNYKRPKVYHIDETWIDTFPRWQRHGPNNSLLKWIHVKAHPRHYKKGESEDKG